MNPFIGRVKELTQLEKLFERKIASLVFVKGRSRIGKSRLIEEFAKSHQFIEIFGLPPTKEITARH